MTAVPPGVMAALDRLNAHARAYGCGWRAIYEYKTVASIALGLAGELTARPFEMGVKCNKCDGTGRFTYWDGGTARCRSCDGRGIAVLKFVEAQHGERIWHHPVRHLSYPVLEAAWGIQRSVWPATEAERPYWQMIDGTTRPISWGPPPASWGPNRPGERLGDTEAAEALNAVEPWILALAPDRLGRFHWKLGEARREMRRYRLSLDREDTICFRCGAPKGAQTPRMGGSGSRFLDFSRAVCQEHYEERPPVWPSEPHPDCITLPVLDWLARHVAIGFDNSDRWLG